MGSFITFLVILTFSALISLLKKKGILTPDDGDEPADKTSPPANQPRPTSTPPPQRPRPAASSWEDELRRLLEGQSTAQRPPPRTAAPSPLAPPPIAPPQGRPPLTRPVL